MQGNIGHIQIHNSFIFKIGPVGFEPTTKGL